MIFRVLFIWIWDVRRNQKGAKAQVCVCVCVLRSSDLLTSNAFRVMSPFASDLVRDKCRCAPGINLKGKCLHLLIWRLVVVVVVVSRRSFLSISIIIIISVETSWMITRFLHQNRIADQGGTSSMVGHYE